jgi:hypothetical protein
LPGTIRSSQLIHDAIFYRALYCWTQSIGRKKDIHIGCPIEP